MHRFIAAGPTFSHLSVLQEVKLREFMDRDDHARYFLKVILPRVPNGKGRVVEGDEFKCVHYQQMPIFTWGDIRQFLRENVKYPADAMQRDLQAKVFVSYVVDEDGSVTDVSVVKGSVVSFNEEAVRYRQKH